MDKGMIKEVYQKVKRDGMLVELIGLSKLSDAISKAFIDSMAREIHPDVLEMLMDEMEDLLGGG